MNQRHVFFVSGVSGTGKSTLGRYLADTFSLSFEEGDSYHSASNIDKMSAGIPLQDVDRWEWLKILNRVAKQHLNADRDVVVSCSALRSAYRDVLTEDITSCCHFIYLHASQSVLSGRLKQREHFFNGDAMLDSQFSALELPSQESAFIINVAQSFDDVAKEAERYIRPVITQKKG
jgi:gluconokinase